VPSKQVRKLDTAVFLSLGSTLFDPRPRSLFLGTVFYDADGILTYTYNIGSKINGNG
jgi:hypothetical protein